MAIEEVLATVSILGFLTAAAFSFKSFLDTKKATNAWLLLTLGFTFITAKEIVTLIAHLRSGYYAPLGTAVELAGIALIFSFMAVIAAGKAGKRIRS
ncbi:hypothetical protein HYX10_06410 [Candidatus Woesearchaeota archaeon]|nr:hypothetical protein [Candidatus Woesearchaeota archaeon]